MCDCDVNGMLLGAWTGHDCVNAPSKHYNTYVTIRSWWWWKWTIIMTWTYLSFLEPSSSPQPTIFPFLVSFAAGSPIGLISLLCILTYTWFIYWTHSGFCILSCLLPQDSLPYFLYSRTMSNYYATCHLSLTSNKKLTSASWVSALATSLRFCLATLNLFNQIKWYKGGGST